MRHALCGLVATLLMLMSAASAEDLDSKQVQYGFENNGSPSYPNCTLAVFISSFPAPKRVNVRLRVDGSLDRNQMFLTITTDVGEQITRTAHRSPFGRYR